MVNFYAFPGNREDIIASADVLLARGLGVKNPVDL
jgi:hypothetical protein